MVALDRSVSVATGVRSIDGKGAPIGFIGAGGIAERHVGVCGRWPMSSSPPLSTPISRVLRPCGRLGPMPIEPSGDAGRRQLDAV